MSEIGDYTGNRWQRSTVVANTLLSNGSANLHYHGSQIGNIYLNHSKYKQLSTVKTKNERSEFLDERQFICY